MGLSQDSAADILRIIYRCQPISRQEICGQSRLGFRRVSALVSQLLGQGLICAESQSANTIGRPPGALLIRPDAGVVLGLDFDSVSSRAVLCDMQGEVLARTNCAVKPANQHDDVLSQVETLGGDVCRAAGVSAERILALGIGIAGQVDAQAGKVLSWPALSPSALGWLDLDVPKEIAADLRVPIVIVDDDVRAMGMNAWRFGAAKGSQCFLYIYLGHGIGSVLFIDGHPYRGAWGLAGHFGHVIIDENGPWCTCGNRGCLETMASARAIGRRARERMANSDIATTLEDLSEGEASVTIATLSAAAQAGDKLAFQLLIETATYIGKALAVALNLLNPEFVVLDGLVAQDDSLFLEAIQRAMRLSTLQHVYNHTRIACRTQDEFSAARGAALMALDALFQPREALLTLMLSRRQATT